jgi:ribonuclease HI
MEMQSVLEALKDFAKISSSDVRAIIVLDSEYVRKGLVEWIPNWKKRGWKKADGGEVLNQDIWEKLEELYRPLARKIDFKIVKGHAGIAGNERADAIAVDFSQGERPTLYSKSWDDFEGDWRDLGETSAKSKSSKAKRKAPKEGFYLSALGKSWQRHETWPECASRVQGVSGAKFKKVKDDSEAQEVLKSWGISG